MIFRCPICQQEIHPLESQNSIFFIDCAGGPSNKSHPMFSANINKINNEVEWFRFFYQDVLFIGFHNEEITATLKNENNKKLMLPYIDISSNFEIDKVIRLYNNIHLL